MAPELGSAWLGDASAAVPPVNGALTVNAAKAVLFAFASNTAETRSADGVGGVITACAASFQAESVSTGKRSAESDDRAKPAVTGAFHPVLEDFSAPTGAKSPYSAPFVTSDTRIKPFFKNGLGGESRVKTGMFFYIE